MLKHRKINKPAEEKPCLGKPLNILFTTEFFMKFEVISTVSVGMF